MNQETKRYIPEDVKRQLRQEVYFGCPVCGSAILDYHHIIPWAELKHNDPAHMIALCPTHHREFGKLSRMKCYELKANPINAKLGMLHGQLGTDKDILSFRVGGNTYINTQNVFMYFGQPILGMRSRNGEVLIQAYLPDNKMWPDLKIVDNDMIVNTNNLWDIEFKTNFVRIYKNKSEKFFAIDLRSDPAIIEFHTQIGGQDFYFGPEHTNIGGSVFKDNVFVNGLTGIGYGNSNLKLQWPSFAMLHPQATIFQR